MSGEKTEIISTEGDNKNVPKEKYIQNWIKEKYFQNGLLGIGVTFTWFDWWYNPPISPRKEPIPDFLRYIEHQNNLDPYNNPKDINITRMDAFVMGNITARWWIDLKNITPKNAVQVIASMIAGSIEYNTSAQALIERWVNIKKTGDLRLTFNEEQAAKRQNDADKTSADIMLMNKIPGICRNYTRVFVAVLDSLKRLQKNVWGSSLTNLYAVPAWTEYHDLVMLVSIWERWSLHLTPIDPTNVAYDLDTKKKNKNPNIDGLAVSSKLNKTILADFFLTILEGYKKMGWKDRTTEIVLSQCASENRIWAYMSPPDLVAVNIADIRKNTRNKTAMLMLETEIKPS